MSASLKAPPGGQPPMSRDAVIEMIAAALSRPDPTIIAVNMTEPGVLVLLDHNESVSQVAYDDSVASRPALSL